MAKDKKGINPAEAFRKEQKKLQIKKNAEKKKVVKEVHALLNDPQKIDEEIEKIQKQSDENKLDKSLKDRILELKQMKSVALKKQQIDINSGKKSAPLPSVPIQSSSTISQVNRRPEESLYFHPIFNPTGLPPPGYAPAFRPLAPPPPPPPTAFQPNNFHFQQMNYINPSMNYLGYSGQNNMIFGGQNGIPPPPPPNFVNPHSINLHYDEIEKNKLKSLQHQNKKQSKKKNVAEYDPLDPAAVGYTNQFGRKEKNENETVLEENDQQFAETFNNDSNPIADDDVEEDVESGLEIDESIQDSYENDSQEEDTAIPLTLPPANFPASFTSKEIDFSQFKINPEEIMKRRNLIPQQQLDAVDSQQIIEDASDEKQNDASLLSLLPGLAEYGDDEDEDEEDENNDAQPIVGPQPPVQDYSNEEIGPYLPANISYNYYDYPSLPDPSELESGIYSNELNVNDDSEQNNSYLNYNTTSDVNDLIEEPGSLPESLKRGSEFSDVEVLHTKKAKIEINPIISSFVPSVLKSKKPKHTPKPPPPPTTNPASTQSVKEIVDSNNNDDKDKVSEIDDAYDLFMSEINALEETVPL